MVKALHHEGVAGTCSSIRWLRWAVTPVSVLQMPCSRFVHPAFGVALKRVAMRNPRFYADFLRFCHGNLGEVMERQGMGIALLPISG
ncbi:MAG: hypothetical protein JW764_03270 [Chlorobiaceae bacterium]|nr:hypothetical protein [Chlorobiaceae bacterium]